MNKANSLPVSGITEEAGLGLGSATTNDDDLPHPTRGIPFLLSVEFNGM